MNLLENLRHAWRLRRLKDDQRKTDGLYRKLIAEAKKKPGPNDKEVEELYTEWRMEDDIHDFEISREQSVYLQRRANELLLPVPELSEKEAWEDRHPGFAILTRKARARLRQEIRDEVRAGLDLPLAVTGTLTGLGGVLVAILAILIGG